MTERGNHYQTAGSLAVCGVAILQHKFFISIFIIITLKNTSPAWRMYVTYTKKTLDIEIVDETFFVLMFVKDVVP